MAASIYATPPPDLSSEDTALSDVSNTSSTNTNTTTNTNTNNNNNSNNNATTAVTTSSSVAVSSTTTSSSSVSSTSSSLNQSSSTLNNHQHHQHQYQQQVSSGGGSKAITMTNTCESKSSTTPKLSTSKSKRTIADVFKDKSAVHHHHHHQQHQQHLNHNISSSSFSNQGGSYSNESPQDDNDSLEHSNTDNGAMAAVAAAANAAMQMQLLEALSDAAKKRRKQHNPTRMDDDNKKRAVGLEYEDNALHQDDQMNIKREQLSPGRSNSSHNPAVDYEDKLSKMFLPKSMEHLKETFELLQQQQQKQFENISKSHKTMEGKSSHQRGHQEEMMTAGEYHQQQQLLQRQASEEEEQETYNNNPYQTYCKECGENFENEFKLSLHMLQEHNEGVTGSDQASGEMTPLDILASVKVKMERPDCESPLSGGHNSNQGNNNMEHSSQMGTNGKDHQQAWMRQPQMPPMGFPFPPEAAAAAALQAGGYLPLLAVPGFPGVDGLNRPPLRIFNPEAFCELCNKEFCNKYFLKTHKANKHGIYDPVGETAGPAAQQTSTMNAMNQMFQLQMQQQQQHLQQQHQMQMELAAQQQQQQQHQQPAPAPPSHPKLESTRKDRDEKSSGSQQQGSSPVYCDICSKRFTNVFAMRRHRTKAHEQNANQNSGGVGSGSSQRNSPNNSQQSSTLDTTSLSNSAADLHSSSKQFQMPDGFRQDFALEQEEVSFTPQPRKLSPQSQQQARDANFAHDKLKRLGVINPEAFCEICCKEYCNKYFLRTHKWKRHGIFMPPEDTENLPKMANWPFMNMPGGVPVNLMMAQRLMVGAENNSEELEQQSQPSKRIKLEASETDEEIAVKEPSSIDENQENRSENNQNLSVPSTPEPQKLHGDNPAAAALTASSEAAMGLQNLQKLQSMIQQLNDLNGKRPLPCHLCGREMENQYALQAHLMAEHSGGLEGMAPMNFPSPFLLQQQQQQQQQAMLKHSPNGSPGSLMPAAMMGGMAAMAGGGELRCTPCDREFSNLPEFQKHITEVHLLAATKGASPLREGFVTPDRPVNAGAAANIPPAANRAPYTLTPTSSYCEICNKELCNKYFMKTHMQRMHGIEIENGAQIGGVVCNICNKELCSKYFLRVHKHNTHGIIEDGAPLPQPRQNGVNNSSEAAQSQQPIPPPLSATAPESLDNLPRNLNMSPFGSVGSSDIKAESTSYTDSCPICNRRFRSAKWLRSHLLNDHGASGMEKLRELEQQYGSLSKPSSPTLKIPNGSGSAGSNSNAATPTHPNVPSPAQLAQALQNLNAQQLLQNIPKQQHQQQPMNYKQERNVPSPRLKEYQCSLCSFTTPYYAFLFIHERTHSIMNTGAGEEQQDNEDKAKALVEQQQQEEEEEEEDQRRAPSAAMEVDKNQQEMIDESQPTNLSMRTPSPRPRPSSSRSLKEELLKETSASSPVLALSRENSVDNDKDFTGRPKQATQSAACSPIYGLQQHHLLLQEMAEQFGKTASYAVPREMANESAQSAAAPPQMQAFVIEEVQTDDCNRFVPAIIYLPVRERITDSMKISFNLTPV